MTAPAAGLRRLAGHPLGPPALLALLVAVVYRDGLWGVPRSDQLVYLYEASQMDGALELLAYSPSWNRAVSIGDHLLFRPVLYLFLAAERLLFGHAFALWQATGIALHALQSFLLYRLLARVAPGRPLAALAVAALFSTLLISSEAVVWHHITGYLLFTVLASLSLSFLLDFLETERPRAAQASLLLALGATFTYELGSVYCWLAAAGTAASALGLGRARRAIGSHGAAPGRRPRLRLAAGLALVPFLYAAISALDFLARLGGIEGSDAGAGVPPDLLRGLTLILYPIYFWAGGVLLPSVYRLGAAHRTMFLEFVWPGGPWLAVNLAAAAAFILGGAGWLLLDRRWSRARLGSLALGHGFVLAYLAVLSFGRLLPRGAAYALYNLHYAYIAILGVLVAQALALRAGRETTREPAGRPGPGSGAAAACRRLFIGGLAGLALVNGVETASLLSRQRHLYAAPRLELLHHAARWHRENRAGVFFEVSASCPGNEPLPWFLAHLRHGTPMPHFLDTLYPATSWNLNREAIGDGKARVLPLSCADGSARADDVLGAWETGAGPAEVRPAGGEAVVLVSQTGTRSEGTVSGGLVAAQRWGVSGLISHDRRYIFWKNGAIWRRP